MSGMPRPRPPHLHREITRHGKASWYFRRGRGKRIRLPDAYGSPEFEEAYSAALTGQPAPGRRTGPTEGSFSWGLELYRRSQAWALLSLATRRQRENIFKGIEAAVGSSRLADWRRGDIVAGRDKRSDRPAAARHFVEALRGFFRWSVEAGLTRADPTDGVKVAKLRTDGFAVWTEEDIGAFRGRWPLGTRERLAFELLLGTGFRRGDAARVGRPHLARDGVIRLMTEKTGERVSVVIPPELVAAIAAGPCGELTFIAGERGRPMTKESFGNWFREACDAAGVKKSAHGIRKSAATADALDGYTETELDAKYGWRGQRMASLYTRTANRERLSLSAAKRTKTRTSIPAPAGQGAGAGGESQEKSNA
jgi:integrase